MANEGFNSTWTVLSATDVVLPSPWAPSLLATSGTATTAFSCTR